MIILSLPSDSQESLNRMYTEITAWVMLSSTNP